MSSTDEKRRIEALKASEQRYRCLFENSKDAIFVADAETGVLLEVNQQAEILTGLSREKLVGMHQSELHPADEITHYLKRFQAKTVNGDVTSDDIVIVHSDGHHIPVNVSASRIELDNEVLIMGVFRDITLRKLAQQFEANQRRILEQIADSSISLPDILEDIVLAAQRHRPGVLGSILLLDDAGKHLRHGAAPDLPESYCSAIDGSAIGPVAGSCGTAAYTGKRVTVTDISSDPLWADYKELAASADLAACWSEPLKSSEGKVLGTFAMYFRTPLAPSAADIKIIERMTALTENAIQHKRAERKVHESRQRLQTVLQVVPESIFMKDLQGRYVFCNPMAERVLGRPQHEIVGRTDFELLSHEVAEHFRENDRLAMANDTPMVNEETVVFASDGHTELLQTIKTAVRDNDNNVIGVLGVARNITAQHKAEQKLKQFRRLMDESNDGVFVVDPGSGRFLDVNRTACTSLGYEQAELLTMSVPDVDLVYREQNWDEIIGTLKTVGSMTMAGEHKRKDGSSFPVEVSIRYVTQDKQAFIIATARDVTERMRYERQLAVLAEAGRTINESLDEQQIARKLVTLGCQLLDCESGAFGLYCNNKMHFREYIKNGEIIPVSLDFSTDYGVPGHVMQTRQPYFSSDARHDPHVIPEIQQQLGFIKLVDTPVLTASGEILGCFEMHDRLDGKDFDEQDIAMLKSLSSIVAGALQNARLLEQREHARDQLASVNRTLRMISDCNQALVRVTDEKSLLTTICQLIVDEGGYVMAWVGEAMHDDERRIKPLAQAGFEKDYLENLHLTWADNELGQGPTGRATREQHSVVCQDILHDPAFLPWREQAIKQGYAAGAAFPLTVDGKVAGVLNIYASEANAFNEEEIVLLEELASDLAFGMEVLRHRNAEDVLEQQLRQAQKMEAIGTLTGGIAHDFNNMLAGMLGTVYLVRKDLQDNPEAQAKLTRIEDTGFRAADVISQLLTFARKGEVHMQPLALSSFLKETIKMARSGVPADIHLTLDVPTDACVVKGDATLLQQVLLNLVTNAKHAVANNQQAEINVTLDRIEPDAAWLEKHSQHASRHYARLSIVDNGCGMDEEIRNKIFDPFFTTKPAGEGTGLGLSMAYGAVQSHEGVIEIESEPGKGSSFHVWLPLIDEQQTTPQSGKEHVLSGNGETILVADDEPSVREVVQELLESMDYRVLTADDGAAAVQLFEQHQETIRLVVLDVVMPQLGGVDAALQIRESNPHIPVVFQTGYGEDLVRQNLTNSCILTKPVDIAEFSRVLRVMLESDA
jgi:PAS domain S-box-containing protein